MFGSELWVEALGAYISHTISKRTLLFPSPISISWRMLPSRTLRQHRGRIFSGAVWARRNAWRSQERWSFWGRGWRNIPILPLPFFPGACIVKNVHLSTRSSCFYFKFWHFNLIINRKLSFQFWRGCLSEFLVRHSSVEILRPYQIAGHMFKST